MDLFSFLFVLSGAYKMKFFSETERFCLVCIRRNRWEPENWKFFFFFSFSSFLFFSLRRQPFFVDNLDLPCRCNLRPHTDVVTPPSPRTKFSLRRTYRNLLENTGFTQKEEVI